MVFFPCRGIITIRDSKRILASRKVCPGIFDFKDMPMMKTNFNTQPAVIFESTAGKRRLESNRIVYTHKPCL